MIKGHNGSNLYEHSLNHCLEFFSKAGGLRAGAKKATPYYGAGTTTTACTLFQGAFISVKEVAMRLLFWVRNPRGGAGNRSGFRECLTWLAKNSPDWVRYNIDRIPHWGRFDDLEALFNTPLESEAAMFWAENIKRGNVLAAKWAKRDMRPLQQAFGVNEAKLRKIIVAGRSGHIVEQHMCGRAWGKIVYSHVPSVAMARYTKAFGRHDESRFTAFKAAVVKGEAKINASVLFPYDCLRTARSGDQTIADEQFRALPDYMQGTDYKIFPIADCSGSMSTPVSSGSSVTMMDVARSLALYCSDRMPKDSPFWRKYLEFSDSYNLIDWASLTFSQAARVPLGMCGGTNIEATLMGILSTAKTYKVAKENMPNVLLILSDMQFNSAACAGNDATVVEQCMGQWEAAGYTRPTIIYWCLSPGYAGQPATAETPNTALVSGFSPALLQSILGGTDFTPMGVMLRAIEDYHVNIPGEKLVPIAITAVAEDMDTEETEKEELQSSEPEKPIVTTAKSGMRNHPPRARRTKKDTRKKSSAKKAVKKAKRAKARR